MKWAVYTTSGLILCLSLVSGPDPGFGKDIPVEGNVDPSTGAPLPDPQAETLPDLVPSDQTLLKEPNVLNPQADNSGMNIIHDGKIGLTADQQSNRPEDLDITRVIRRSIVKNKDLSIYAHNVKIITRDGMVVLKGPVRSLSEKQSVEDAAVAVAGSRNVRSELEVTSLTSR